MDVPVRCAGAYVRPGDMIVGDRDGIVVAPHEAAEALVVECEDLLALEKEQEIAIRDGASGTAWFSAVPTPALVACCVVAMALGSLIGLSRAQAYDRESSLAVERRYVESIHPVMMSVDHTGHDH